MAQAAGTERPLGTCVLACLFFLIGFLEDQILPLSQLICANGFTTDASTPGVERLAVSSLRPDAGCAPDHRFDAAALGADGLLEPAGVMMAKGWSRSCCMHAVLLCIRETGILQETEEGFRERLGCAHGSNSRVF